MFDTPFPIFCRGHSGGRLLCELYQRNEVQMGDVSPEKRDTGFFSADNPYLRQIIMNAFQYERAGPESQNAYQELMRSCIEEFRRTQHIDVNRPYGWKHGISLFCMVAFLDAFPAARAIHLIRDGRDVMLSRLNARIENLADPLNRLAVFGDPEMDNFQGQPLNPETVRQHRNALEMQHWVTAVEFGLQGRDYPQQYLEVKYEAFCQSPVETAEYIFDFLGLPLRAETRQWIAQAVYHGRVGKWRTLSDAELALPLKIGGPLLAKLGYL